MEAIALIRELAHQLQQTGNIDVSIQLPTDVPHGLGESAENVCLEDGKLIFSSLEQRNLYAAEHVFELIQPRLLTEPGLLFDEAYTLWQKERRHPDKASGRLIALGSSLLDPLSLATKRIRRSGRDAFKVIDLLDATLPHLESLKIDSLIELSAAEHIATKNDMFGGRIHLPIQQFLARHPEFTEILYQRMGNEVQEATMSLHCDAVLAISELDFAKAVAYACADIQSTLPARALAGTWVLGRLLLHENCSAQDSGKIESALMHLLEHAEGDLLTQAIRTATSTMHKTRVFDDALKRLGHEGNMQVSLGVAYAFSSMSHEMSQREDFDEWLDILVGTKPEYQGILDPLDDALEELLSDPVIIIKVIDFIGKWARQHGKSAGFDTAVATAFDSCIFSLADNQAVFPSLLTDWLLSDELPLPANLAGVLGKLAERHSEKYFFDKHQIDTLGLHDLLFLARRTLGFIRDVEHQLSLVLSLLRIETSVERVFPLLRGLLVSELGYDYPGRTISACQEAATKAKPAVSDFLGSVINEIELRQKAYRDLPSLEDLRPSTQLRRLMASARAKQIDEAFEEASKNSIFRQFATQIPIKAGRGTFQFRDGAYAEPIQLSSFSQEIDIPRREISDPIGNAMRIRNFRLAKRGRE